MHKLGTADHLIYEQRTPCPTGELRNKEADRRTSPDQVSAQRARAGVTGHNVRYVLGFGLPL